MLSDAILAPILSSLSPLWAVTNALARKAMAPRAARLPVPVISVGNVVAGGVGKTEVAAAIAARLLGRGKRVVVASRGYGSRWERAGGVAHDAVTAAELRFPDEAQVVLHKAPGAIVAVGANRREVLRRHWEELQPDAVILDDGLQHFAIARDLDVVVHDFSIRWPVLRDLPAVLKNASVKVSLSEVPPRMAASSGTWVRARYALPGATDARGALHELPSEAMVFCGLGNPQRFRRALEAAGVRVRGWRSFRDHMEYGPRQARELAAWSQGANLLTSLKDYVKLAPLVESQGGVAGFEPRWVGVRLELTENGQMLWDAVDRCAR